MSGGAAASERDVMDRATGKPRRLREMCSTCIMRPVGERIALPTKRLREFINQARAADTYVICHSTLPAVAPEGVEPAICRGYADAYTSNFLRRICERLGGFTDVDPPQNGDVS